MHGYIGGALGHAIELLQVDPKGPVELEYLRADGLAGRIGDLYLTHPKVIHQGRIDDKITYLIKNIVNERYGFIGDPLFLNPVGHVHEVVKCLPLNPGRILNLDHDLGQDILPDPGRCKDMGGSDLLLVMCSGGGTFRTVDAEPGTEGLAVREDVVPDPGHGEIGHDIFRLTQVVPFKKTPGTHGNLTVGQYDPFGITGGA